MTIIPILKTPINLDKEIFREALKNLLFTLESNTNICGYLHLDLIYPQKMLIKIQNLEEKGSLRDLIHNSSPLDSFNKKYSRNKTSIPLNQISEYGSQILSALNHFHENRCFYMNLHTGNILVNQDTNKVKLIDYESFFFDFPIKNEQYYFYLIELFLEEYHRETNDKQSAMLSDIFSNKFNVFEMIDLVSFGRVLYEMHTGKELNAPYPDDLEYSEMDSEVSSILKKIFPKKVKATFNTKIHYVSYPEISVSKLLALKFFNNETKNINKTTEKDDDSILKFEIDGLSHIKEEIFNQQRFISNQFNKINSYKN